MLSRIAESLFWIGRYIERADDTARILDVQTQLLLEDGSVDETQTCRDLLSSMGVEPGEAAGFGIDMSGPVTIEQVHRVLLYDPASPSSIAAVLGSAREAARGARETLTVPLWEVINTSWRPIPSGHFLTLRPPYVFQWVRERAALITGTADATMTRDESWQFIMLGRTIERADMTSRLVATTALSGAADHWTSALRASGSYDAFLRTYRGVETDRAAAEFLLLDRLFPRSVVFSLDRAEQALDNLNGDPRRAGFQDEAHRLLGRVRAELEYRALPDLLDDLPAEMERLQRTCAAATDAISRRYFAGAEALAWKGVGA
ncbi:alpha-E domain-containing protein [Nocardioides sp. zg-536]|uniref:Alpha-E domain-containing protein n=1 Tax=Nocardioides faecalis TaxID=2803858 RepID=A0A938YAF9_9ACTN|nr:alpha-E domain-containing protein [Nocardioides faecalis]MBM9460249.1 alpha-E domain-containing protein [Nocardioides faecalis]MBS4754628.1 alpha-E domain-containing protein [Nocardioides faecalis]QVI59964.1 alpha-E domain-containing protein [Nocardioides faecalis]